MNWDENDLNTKFLLAKPIELSGIGTLKPLTIDKISNIGFVTYNQYLSLLCVSSTDISEMLEIDDKIIEPFEFIIENFKYGSNDFRNQVMNGLELFFSECVSFYVDDEYFSIGDINEGRFLHKANYNFFVDLLKRMNCISLNSKKDKPKSEAEKSFWKRLKETRAKYNKSNNEADMSDIISAVCCKHPSINLFNVGGLTIYQLINQYMRLNSICEYEINLNSLIHGCDSKSVNLSHWSSKLKLN